MDDDIPPEVTEEPVVAEDALILKYSDKEVFTESFPCDYTRKSRYQIAEMRKVCKENSITMFDISNKQMTSIIDGKCSFVKNMKLSVFQQKNIPIVKYLIGIIEWETKTDFGMRFSRKYPVKYATSLVFHLLNDSVLHQLTMKACILFEINTNEYHFRCGVARLRKISAMQTRRIDVFKRLKDFSQTWIIKAINIA